VTERTLVIVKPDGVQHRLIGEVISRIERKGPTSSPSTSDRGYRRGGVVANPDS
jgi:hypothetical protein